MQHFYRVFYVNLLIILVLLGSVDTSAQTDIKIGTGTDANPEWVFPCPLPDARGATRSQYLFLASELKAAGMNAGLISALSFHLKEFGENYNPNDQIDNVIIKIGTTTTGSLSATAPEAGTAVVHGPLTHKLVLGDNKFNFITPFFWNGDDNLVVEVCTDAITSGNSSRNALFTWTTGLPFNGSFVHGEYWDNTFCNTNVNHNEGDQKNRPNIVFSWVAVDPCASATLTAGAAAANNSYICSGESVALSVNGASVATGLSYQWQSSVTAGTWTNITGATRPALTLTQNTTTSYRVVVTCATGGTATSTAIQVVNPALLSGNFTIDKNKPAGSGNFQSFNEAYSFIRCGINGPVVFDVAAGSGIYSESLKMKKVPGASAVNTVTFKGNGNTIESTSSTYDDRAVIQLDGGDYFIFDNLNIKTGAGLQYGYGIQLLNDADTNVVRNCVITLDPSATSDNFSGIVVSKGVRATEAGDAFCDGNSFTDNTIHGGNYGIIVTGSLAVPNANTKILRNRVLDFYEAGIYLAYSFTSTIDSNIISRPAASDANANLKGIYVTGRNTRLNISRNTIHNIFGGMGGSNSITFYGIDFDSAPAASGLESTVSNNLIYDIRGGGDLYGLYNMSSGRIFYFYNTVSLDGPASGNSNTTTGIYLADAVGVLFHNNNIAVTRPGGGTNVGINFGLINTSDNASDKNNLYVAPGAGTRLFGVAVGVNKPTMADWTITTGFDLNSMSEDPLFTDLATGDLRPKNAALNDVAIPVTIGIDITSAARHASTPDIGAFEFSPPVCTSPPTPGTISLSTNALCIDLPVSITLTGNSTGATQTYQLESAPAAAGPFTAVGNPKSHSSFSIAAATSLYYRVKVTCGANSAYSNVVFLTVHPPFAGASNYTINKNQPASATNFQSLTAAYNAMECGISGPVVFTVEAGSGPYVEQLIWKRVKGVSDINTITFKGNGNTVSFSATVQDQKAVLKLDGADHVHMDNFIFQATGTTYGFGVQLINDADSNSVRNSVIRTSTTSTNAMNFAGIVVGSSHTDPISPSPDDYSDCDVNLFENNTIIGGYYGITTVGNVGPYPRFVRENKIINNKIQDFYSRGIFLKGTGKGIVEGNTISRPTRTAVGAFYGIQIQELNGELQVRKNRITTPFGASLAVNQPFYGIYVTDLYWIESEPNYVYNNLIYNVKGIGAQTGIYSNFSGFIKFYNNTIALDDVSYTGTTNTAGFGTSDELANPCEFSNNIVTITRGGNGFKYGFNSAAALQNLIADRNDYYIKGAGENNYIGNRTTPRLTLKDWRDALLDQEKNSISENPVYADTAAGNFTPTVAPLDNKGASVIPVTTDILNKTRHASTPDIGAYEFDVVTCLGSISGGQSTATPNPAAPGICMGTDIVLSLNNNTTSGYQTYQWENAASPAGPWVKVGELTYTKELKTKLFHPYYRCLVSCSGFSAYSDPVQVNRSGGLPAGEYLIKKTGGDFVSFTAAVNAMSCGILGAVTFNVAPDTYSEQVSIGRIPGATDTSRVTFRSQNGDNTSVKLTAAGTSAINYVLRLADAEYVTIKGISVISTGTTFSRAIVFTGNVAYDSITNNIITMPATAASSTDRIALFASSIKGNGIVISNNAITNGASAIYVSGTSSILNKDITVERNSLRGFYQYGIHIRYTDTIKVNNNTLEMGTSLNTTAYGIYADEIKQAYRIYGNAVTISNSPRAIYGIYLRSAMAKVQTAGIIKANKIVAVNNLTGAVTGLYVEAATNPHMMNNTISIRNSGFESYGLYSYANKNGVCFNNSVQSTATTNGGVAAHFGDSYNVEDWVDIRNNIFTHEGGGIALSMENRERFYSDYNMLYTTGAILVRGVWQDFDNLKGWKDFADQDVNSIVFKPAFVADNTLKPDVAKPEVWAMNGRGVQIEGNDIDINNNKRAVALKEGVPDLGAYEFEPASIPVACVAHPATPVAGDRQLFMLGSDTVTAITWGSTVASSVTVRRYSGAAPPALSAGTDHMYFYVDAEFGGGATGAGYKVEQYYLDPWRGFIDKESRIRLGKTDASGSWSADLKSAVNTIDNTIGQSGLNYLAKLTGLTDTKVNYPSTDTTALFDSTHMGTRFWVGHGHSNYVGPFTLNMGGSEKDADVTVKINGTTWVKTYHIPANSFVISDEIPKDGISGALLRKEGWSERSISIESTEPITVYARGDTGPNSYSAGSTLVLPVGAYGYEYFALSSLQYKGNPYEPDNYSWFFVIADQDSTLVEITPSNPTVGGNAAGKPFTVLLNRGEVYQVLGAIIGTELGYDLSGSHIRSIGNEGKCRPIAVFSGSSRALIDCKVAGGWGGSYLIQQNYPVTAWGRNFITAPTSRGTFDPTGHPGPATFMKNMYRVVVKDPATVVKVNGSPLAGLTNGYYEYWSAVGDVIESDKPVMVAQYIPDVSNTCNEELGGKESEMFYLVPVENGIKKSTFFRSNQSIGFPTADMYLTVVIPTAGLSTLKIDGGTDFAHTYTHPNKAGYTVVVKLWKGAVTAATSTVEANVPFTGMLYGWTSASYGYTLGSHIPNLAHPGITNMYDSTGSFSTFNCVGTPFKHSVLLPVQSNSIIWKFSTVPNMTPAVDSIQDNPKYKEIVMVDGTPFYKYEIQHDFVFSAAGDYILPVEYANSAADNCSGRIQKMMKIKVVGTPVAAVDLTYTGCLNDVAQLKATVTAQNGDQVEKYKWDFGDATASTLAAPSKQYTAANNYTIKLDALTKAGCIAKATLPVTVKDIASFSFVSDLVNTCNGAKVDLAIKTPQAGVTYSWYESLTGGTAVHAGTTYEVTNITGSKKFYVEASLNGCTSRPRQEITANAWPAIPNPVAAVDSVAVNLVRFTWTAVPGVTTYQVSADGGTTWVTPSAGAGALTHTVSGLEGGKEVKLIVKAVHPNGCTDGISAVVATHTLPADVFIPNAFTPNGDNRNEVFKIEGYVIRSMQLMIFNQWGEKVFESNDQAVGWDGRYKGQMQASGVYIYVCSMTLLDGSKLVKKGSVNLVR